VIVAVTDGDKLLLSKYAGRAYTRYALLAGYTEIGETIEQTVHREVMEEVGLRVKNLRYYKSQPWGTEQDLLLGYFCDLDGDDTIDLDEDELSTAEWVHRDDMNMEDDGFSLTREMMVAFQNGEV
jgi:NAD+ diphosphatase